MSLMPWPGQEDANRRAMLDLLSATQQPRQGSTVDRIGRMATDIAPQIAKLFPAGKIAPSGFLPGGGLSPGGFAKPGIGAAGTMGIGIAGEVLGSLLKPKAQQAKMGDFEDYLRPYRRREEGSGDGVLGGAAKWGGRGAQIGSVIPGLGTAIGGGIGAAVGAIGNLFTKNAASAQTDFTVDDAKSAIRNLYRAEGGRDVGDDELMTILKGQGWKPGDRWVGEKGMLSVMGNLRNNFSTARGGAPLAPRSAAPAASGGRGDIGSVMARANSIRNLDRDALIAQLGGR